MQTLKPRFCLKAAELCCPDPSALEAFGVPALEVDRTLLPAPLRRRASLTTQMAVTAANRACTQARVEPRALPSVFASLGGEIRVTDELCRALQDSAQSLSPTRFHNSVHNATAGYWGILHACGSPATAIAALEDTFALGLLEACAQLGTQAEEILLVCYDEFWPEYLAPPKGGFALAAAFVLGRHRAETGLAMISRPSPDSGADPWNPELERLIEKTPISACIYLMQALKKPYPQGRVRLSAASTPWSIELEPL